MNPLFIAIISIALSVAAQFSLKAGMNGEGVRQAIGRPFGIESAIVVLTDHFVALGFVLYGLGAIAWLGVLSRWDVSKAYPLVGLGFAFTMAIGFAVGEQVTPARLLGVVLICAGVFVVARS